MPGLRSDPAEHVPPVRRWLHALARALAWIGGAGTAASLAFAGIGAAAGRGDPHGGGLWWAIGTDVLPWTFGLLVSGLLAWIATKPRAAH